MRAQVALLAAGMAVLAGCSNSVEAEDPTISSMLRLIPAAAGPESPVFVNLYAKAGQAGVTSPAAGASGSALEDYYADLFGPEPDSAGYAPSALWAPDSPSRTDIESEFGIELPKLTADIYAGKEPEVYTAAVGEIDGERIARAAPTSTVGDHVTTKEIDGVEVVSWLKDNEFNVELPHPLSPIGGSGRLAAVDGTALLYGRADATVERLIAAYHGDEETLADNAELAEVAAALDAQDVRAAVLSTGAFGPPQGLSSAQLKAAGIEGIGSYRAYGVGVVRTAADGEASGLGGSAKRPAAGVAREVEDFGERLVVVALGTEETASDLGAELERVATEGMSWQRQPWSELLGDPRVDVDGAVVTASFSVKRARMWYDLVGQQDSLLFPG